MFCIAFEGRKQTIYLTNFTYLLNNLTTEKTTKAKISRFVIHLEVIIYLLW